MNKNIITLLSFCILALSLFTACDEDADQALKDIIKEDHGFLPVITGFTLQSPASQVSPGNQVSLDLRFWSQGEIGEIKLYSSIDGEDPVEISSTAYTEAYSEVTRTDSLILQYTIPANIAQPASIRLDAEVINTNSLTRTSSVELEVE